jgi:hypothetical protein
MPPAKGKPGKFIHITFHNVLIIKVGLSRTFVNAWQSSMKLHDIMAENRLRFAQRLNEMSEELANLNKEVEKNKKQVRMLCQTPYSPRLKCSLDERPGYPLRAKSSGFRIDYRKSKGPT